jgi:acetyl-CoA carboxylase biotin carboxyl carrier protein
MHAPPAPAPAAAPVDDKSHVVTSPFVGTFYRKPNPDSPNYVSMSDHVDKGAVLCIVEAMKLMNEIEADVSGTIVAILVEDGAPVEYGQPLFKIAA